MKQKIEQLSKGYFEYRLPEILLSHDKLVFEAEAGKTYQGSFTVKNNKGSRMKGVLYSSSRLFVLSNDKFIGEENIITYQLVADYADTGELITGEVSIVSDCGEACVPFEAKVIPPYCKSSVGVIKDLFQFTNLAKSNRAEAEQLFASAMFAQALVFYDKKLVLMYHHLLQSTSVSLALEEFLVAIHKKLQVTFSADKSELSYDAGQYSFLDKLLIKKNTWGYGVLTVITDAPFIRLEHNSICTDDFNGNSLELQFVIEPEKMREGKNFGSIVLSNIQQKIVIPVTCHCIRTGNEKRVTRRREKGYYLRLLRNYLKFRLNKISSGKYASEAESVLHGLENAGKADPLYDLYRIHLLIAEGKETAARNKLAEFEATGTRMSGPVMEAACLYLEAVIDKQSSVAAACCEEINRLYLRNPEEWLLLWFLLYMDKKYEYAKQKKWDDCKTQFYRNCYSPVLYYEAVSVLNEEPSVLKELGVFEQNVIRFGIKNRILTSDTCLQICYLAERETSFEPLLFRDLVSCYQQYTNKELLLAIDNLLIQGNRVGEAYFPWFSRGVEQQIKLPRLHEYYVASLSGDVNQLLNHSVLTYFAYNNELNDVNMAFLYANILRNRERYAFIYHNYEKKIEQFTLRQLEKGAIDRNLAVLYDEILTGVEMTAEIARQLPDVAFYYELTCDNPNMTAVCVVHKECLNEVLVPMKNGSAFVEIFTENAEILLLDEQKDRYISTVSYTLTKLLHLEGLFEQCCNLSDDNPKLLLNLAEKVQFYQKFDEGAIELRKRVGRLPGLTPDYLRDYIRTLIYFYYDNYEGDMLESYLMQLELTSIEHAERTKLIEFMIIRDLFNVALKAMAEYGFEGIDYKRLMKLCSRLILNAGGMEKVDVLVAACFYVFKAGKYDETILGYLTDYYYGTTMEMFELWKAARTFEVETLDLEERLLGQMLFAESYISNAKAVFSSYYRSGCNRKLIRAFLSYYAYKYLLNDRLVEHEIFDIMRRELNYEENEVCLLAVLKWYSTKEQLNDSEVNFIDFQLHKLEQKNMILPFFRNFKGSMRIPQNIYDKYYVEYRTNPNCEVTIHYLFEGMNADGAFISEPMKNVCYGIFVKEFIVFCNESLQYYITEKSEGGETITESIQVWLPSEQAVGEDTKFYQLNLIIAAREMQDEKTVLKLMENYVKTDYAIMQLFHPL